MHLDLVFGVIKMPVMGSETSNFWKTLYLFLSRFRLSTYPTQFNTFMRTLLLRKLRDYVWVLSHSKWNGHFYYLLASKLICGINSLTLCKMNLKLHSFDNDSIITTLASWCFCHKWNRARLEVRWLGAAQISCHNARRSINVQCTCPPTTQVTRTEDLFFIYLYMYIYTYNFYLLGRTKGWGVN